MAKRIFFIVLSVFLWVGSAMALDVPTYKGRVNDFSGMLKSDQTAQLEKKLERYEGETSNQIAILTIPSLEGDDLEDFSIRVADKWKIGQRDKDNGILVLVVLNDHKMRIEVGRGLEGSLTDLVAGRIVDSVMKPAFKEKAYYKGLDGAIDAIQLAVKGEFKSDAVKKDDPEKVKAYLFFYGLIVVIAGFMGIIHIILGGITGAAGWYFATAWLFHPGFAVLAAVAAVGFFFGLIAKFLLEASVMGGGGGSSGGDSSFGFGGGGFGGGGASGGW